MLKFRRIKSYQNRSTIENILTKFDSVDETPHTGSKARDVSSLSQTSTIAERNGGKMVTQEMLNKRNYSVGINTAEKFLARVAKPIVYFRDSAELDRVIVLPGTLIAVVGDIALIGDDHVSVTPDQYTALDKHQ